MDDDPGAADDERTIELSSIAAIFPELISNEHSPYDATLNLDVSPSTPLRIRFNQSAEKGPPVLLTPPNSTEPEEDGSLIAVGKRKAVDAAGQPPDVHDLAHLPPLKLHIRLPKGYPTAHPPTFSLSSSPPWIPKTTLKSLKADGLRLWEELGKDQVVFTYIDHLQQLADAGFNLAGDLREDVDLSADMKLALLDFDLKTKRELFEKETFDCGICLEPKKGLQCHRLMLCSHVFCVECLQDFYNNCIREGDVDNIKCLTPNCGKEARQVQAGRAQDGAEQSTKPKKIDRSLNPSELLQIPIKQEVVQRYVRLKRKKRLESDKTTIYCPRQWCQGAARSKKHPKPMDPFNDAEEVTSGSDAEEAVASPSKKSKKPKDEYVPMSERLSICEDCNFAFCSVCKKGWHGELAFCNPRRLGEVNAEEKASLLYLQMHTTACPTCSAPAQKTMGCNHMICFKCNTHFCYLCSAYLMPDNPYKHYNDLKSPCYMRLWELEGGDGDPTEVGLGFAGGADLIGDDVDEASDVSSDTDEEDNFIDLGGGDDFIHFSDDEDTSDDEPAPDQRRPQGRDVRIEIVNFARAGGAGNARVFQDIPAVLPPAPPAAPIPPRRGRRAAQRQARPQVQQQAGRANLPRAGVPRRERDLRVQVQVDVHAQLQEHGHEIMRDEEIVHAGPAPGQGRGAAQQRAPLRAMGLERFLELAQRDQEDEWDSDELDE